MKPPPTNLTEITSPTDKNQQQLPSAKINSKTGDIRGTAMLYQPPLESKNDETLEQKLFPLPSIDNLLNKMINNEATDLYLTYGSPPAYRINEKIIPLATMPLADNDLKNIINQILTEEQIDDFESTLELNTAKELKDGTRIRINAYRQQQHDALVIRKIQATIPTLEELELPNIYSKLILEKRGLILIVGPTGSGKSTSLASMIQHRNKNTSGHIITIEDPIEYIHQHQNCIVSQRDIGIDTYSFSMALKNALRQQPDVIMIGEIRDRETMEHALNFSETGHLCLATLHANNANQAIERVLSFFPEENRKQILLNLSLNIKGIFSQRLVPNKYNSRSIALEILLNEGLIRDLIKNGEIKKIKELMAKSKERGMQTFDQSLFELYMKEDITEEIAISHSDNPANIRLLITQQEHKNSSQTNNTLNTPTINSSISEQF